MDELLSDVEGVKTYIDDTLVLINVRLSQNIEQPRIIFGRLRAAGLIVNDPRCSFGLKEIPYLGNLIITRAY